MPGSPWKDLPIRSEEHTSEIQSHSHLVCRLLLEKKKIKQERSETMKSGKNGGVEVHLGALDAASTWCCDRRRRCRSVVSIRRSRFFFFKGSGSHRNSPSSPPRPSPD